MRLYFSFLKDYKKQMIVGPFFKMLEAVFELIMPVVMAVLIDRGIHGKNLPLTLRAGGFMLLLAAAGLGSALVCQYYASVASQGFGTKLRDHLFRHICGFSHAELDRFSAASLSNRLTVDVQQMQLAVAMTIRLAIRAPLLCVGGVAAAMLIDWRLALIVLAALPVFSGALYLILKISSRLFRAVQTRLDALSVAVGENLEGVRVIRAFARAGAEEKRFDTLNAALGGALRRALSASALSGPVTGLIINAALVGVIWFGGFRVDSGGMTQGEIVAFISYMSQILLALAVTANLLSLYTRAGASTGRVAEILAVSPGITEPDLPAPMPAMPAAIEFRDVSLSYGGDPALSGISFQARPGEIIGVIGPTGSGKSSLMGLIPRFYDVSEGEILLGGADIRTLPLDKLRREIAVVAQRAELFSGTVLSNLQMGNPDIDESAAREAARTAQALEFIEGLPRGFDSPVERGGANFSGGQRQRLSIARALAKRPSVLILDDSASALDFATEARLWRALREETRAMTVFIVSQRVSAVRRADRILVLADGRAEGMGTHEALYQSCGIYREICDTQEQGTEGETP